MTRSATIILLAAAIAASPAALIASAPRPARSQDLVPGKVIESVPCAASSGFSYALYLPAAFEASRPWPVLVLFDPGARGPLAVEAFRVAAEAHGWVLAASNDSRNGPLRESALAAQAMWRDLRARLPVDDRRVYASGFSGGARVASVFPRLAGLAPAGVIGCGAGLAAGIEPAALGAAAYFGLAGLRDFNYPEMTALDRALDPTGVPHRFLYFDGIHAWPDAGSCGRAVGWLEIEAMKRGLRPVDREMAAAYLRRELEDADAFEAEGRVFWAAERLAAAARLAEGLGLGEALPALAGLAGRVAALEGRKEYARFVEAERKRDRRAAEFRQAFGDAFGAVEDAATGGTAAVPAVLRATGVAFLKKQAAGKGTVEDRAAASRGLFDFAFAARARAAELAGKGDLGRSAAYLDLALEACEAGLPMEPALHYDRACVAARSGDRELALRHLGLAVDKGFANLGLLETDRDLDAVRDGAAFRGILERVRARREADRT
jgi:dienelactone hydrolase